MAKPDRFDTVVVGAGAFGGWTALSLQRAGHQVLLIDAWGPGNSRSSSGGETRVFRAMYGGDPHYVDLVVRARDLWQNAEREWRSAIYVETGAFWMCRSGDPYVTASLPVMAQAQLPVDELTLNQARSRFPQISLEGIEAVYFERKCGYLRARPACRFVWESFVDAGGAVSERYAELGDTKGRRLQHVVLNDGTVIRGTNFVLATGPWLTRLFDAVMPGVLSTTRQEVYYFGGPGGDDRFAHPKLPVWIELADHIVYGVPDRTRRGFKVGDDTRGPRFDPTSDDRLPTPSQLDFIRAYLERRFPEMGTAPLIECRVCQYTNTPDGHFLIDRLPEWENVWVVGGGSGHGFKFGPVIGQDVAASIISGQDPHPMFSLRRLPSIRGVTTQFQHI